VDDWLADFNRSNGDGAPIESIENVESIGVGGEGNVSTPSLNLRVDEDGVEEIELVAKRGADAMRYEGEEEEEQEETPVKVPMALQNAYPYIHISIYPYIHTTIPCIPYIPYTMSPPLHPMPHSTLCHMSYLHIKPTSCPHTHTVG
jgi:hypothetical protein